MHRTKKCISDNSIPTINLKKWQKHVWSAEASLNASFLETSMLWFHNIITKNTDLDAFFPVLHFPTGKKKIISNLDLATRHGGM